MSRTLLILYRVTEILDVAPIDLIHGLTKEFANELPLPDAIKAQAVDIEFHWVNEKGGPARLTSNVTLQATVSLVLRMLGVNAEVETKHSFETAPKLDIVLIGASFGYDPNEAELAYIRKAHKDCFAFLTICGGFDPALKAGLLEGKTATAPRFLIERLRQSNPEVNWVERRWACDGKVWTSGTLLNGTDMLGEWGRRTFGAEGSLMGILQEMGGVPVRDVEYRDVDGKL